MDVVGIGTPVYDILTRVEKMPVANRGELILEYSCQGGNKVPTAMVALACLGAKTGLIGVVGGCSNGRFCLDDLIYHNIDTSNIVVDKNGETPICIIISDEETHGRSILYKPGNLRPLTVDDFDETYIASSKYLHIAEISPAIIEVVEKARKSGVKIVIDADNYYKEVDNIIPLVDVFIASEFYYDAVFSDRNYKENCKRISERGPKIVVFTFGERGCIGLSGDSYFEIPAFKVDVRDTNGAGDVFHGAFIYGLLQNWEIEQIASFSSAVSAIKCTKIGGRAGIPDLDTVMKFIETGRIDYTNIDRRVERYRKQD